MKKSQIKKNEKRELKERSARLEDKQNFLGVSTGQWERDSGSILDDMVKLSERLKEASSFMSGQITVKLVTGLTRDKIKDIESFEVFGTKYFIEKVCYNDSSVYCKTLTLDGCGYDDGIRRSLSIRFFEIEDVFYADGWLQGLALNYKKESCNVSK